MTTIITDPQVHPLAGWYRKMSDVELDALAEDIKENGLRDPIVLDQDGQLIEGRNRLAACKRAEIPITDDMVYVLPPDDDPVAFIKSKNSRRRHDDLSAQVMVEVVANDFPQLGCGKSEAPKGRGRPRKGARTQAELAKLLGVSEFYIRQAEYILAHDEARAREVIDTPLTISEAYDAIKAEERDAEERAAHRAALEDEARQAMPDVLEQWQAGKLNEKQVESRLKKYRKEQEAAQAREERIRDPDAGNPDHDRRVAEYVSRGVLFTMPQDWEDEEYQAAYLTRVVNLQKHHLTRADVQRAARIFTRWADLLSTTDHPRKTGAAQ